MQNISFNDAKFIYIYIAENFEDEEFPGELLDEHDIIETHCCKDFFTKDFEDCFEDQNTRFLYKIPTKPFYIVIRLLWWRQFPYPSRWELRAPFRASLRTTSSEVVSDEEIDVDSEEKEPSINTEQTFKSTECVICLTNPSNVLFCNCGHIAICVECDKVKSLFVQFVKLKTLLNELYIIKLKKYIYFFFKKMSTKNVKIPFKKGFRLNLRDRAIGV